MKTIMVVDDSRFVQEEVAHFLEGTNYLLSARCRDAEEAIRAYSEAPPDIVLMDIVLPGIDGMEATGAIIKKWPDARIVIMSSLAYEDTDQNARRAGARACLFKPFKKDGLLKALEEVSAPE